MLASLQVNDKCYIRNFVAHVILKKTTGKISHVHAFTIVILLIAVADPGFPRGGGANSSGGAPTYNFAKFSQKLHEIERIWARGGGARVPRAPLDLPLNSTQ